jgi:uncharacterized protein (DUF849 family)
MNYRSARIVNCAVTGAIHIPSLSNHLPVTLRQIADEAVAACEAGASSVHVHARDPVGGEPTMDIELFREICRDIESRSDVVICITTGGATWEEDPSRPLKKTRLSESK